MKKFITTFLPAFLVLMALPAMGQSTPGIILPFQVDGDVRIIRDADGMSQPLVEGRSFSEGFTIQTGANGSVTFVQSNGSVILMEENTSLTVLEYKQTSVSEMTASEYLKLNREPNGSQTRFRLNSGDISGETKTLNAGSSYRIETNEGNVNILGTVWVISYNASTGRFSTSAVTGTVVVNSPDGTSRTVSANESLVVVAGNFTETTPSEEAINITNTLVQQIQAATGVETLSTTNPITITTTTTPAGDSQTVVDLFSPAGG